MSEKSTIGPRLIIFSIGVIGLAVIVIASLFFAERTVEIVPVWEVKVVDQAGKPVIGLPVTQTWEFFGLPGHGGSDTRKTDGQGWVTFPAQSFRTSMSRYLAGWAFSLLNVHASFGAQGLLMIVPSKDNLMSATLGTDGEIYDEPGVKTIEGKSGLTTLFHVKTEMVNVGP